MEKVEVIITCRTRRGGSPCTRAHLKIKTEAKRSLAARPADYQFPRNVFYLFCKFYHKELEKRSPFVSSLIIETREAFLGVVDTEKFNKI